MTASNSIFLIAAHPDDELLGCGGTIKKATLDGIKVYPVIACEGVSVRHTEKISNQKHINQTKAACKILQTEDPIFLNLPDQNLDKFLILEITKKIEILLNQIKPNIIFIHDYSDLNQDHNILTRSSLIACRPTSPFINSVYMFNTVSSTEWGFPREFKPDTWVDISSTINDKIKAFECYKSEIKSSPHPRSIEGLISHAKYWGSHQLLNYAEVFRTVWNRSNLY